MKPLRWIGSSWEDLKSIPKEVRKVFGFALYQAQSGNTHRKAKPLSGFGHAGVIEIIEDYNKDTFRAVYTVRFAEAIYVLHVFKKKSKRGVETPKSDMELIRSRYRQALDEHTRNLS